MADWRETAQSILLGRLQRTTQDLPGGLVLATEINSVARRIAGAFPVIGGLAGADALTGDDADNWGEAVGLTAASRLRKFVSKANSTGELVEVKIADKQFEFAPPSAAQLADKPLEQIWLDEAYQCLVLIPAIAEQQAVLTSFSHFQAGGRRRSAKEAGFGTSLYNPLYNLWVDEVRETGLVGMDPIWFGFQELP